MFFFTGMLDSGKTSMIKTLLDNPELVNGRKILILLCEEGEEEYDVTGLAAKNVHFKVIDDESLFSATTFRKIEKEFKPDYVIIEYNGMWKGDAFLDIEYPKGYGIAEIMTTVDASTFKLYLSNMKPMMALQYRYTDMVVFNRFTHDMDGEKFNCRATVKAQNLAAKVIFEYEDGTVDSEFDASPFDLTKDEIDIPDTDFGVFYFDVMESVSKYAGKRIKALVKAVRLDKRGMEDREGFLVGRLAMTCCAADQSFLGLVCVNDMPFDGDEAWVRIDATVLAADGRVYGEPPEPKLPVLRVHEMTPVEKPEDEVVGI